MNYLKKLDIFGEEFEFNYKKKSRYKTHIGGLLTMLAYLALTYIFIIMIFDMSDKTKPTLAAGIQYSRNIPRMDLYNNTIYPIIGFDHDGLVPSEEVNKFIHAFGEIQRVSYESLAKLEEMEVEVLERFDFIPCKSVSDPIKEKLYSSKLNVGVFGEKFGLCPNFTNSSNYFVKGNIINSPFVKYMIEILPCKLEADDYAECATYIDIVSETSEIIFILPEFNFIAENEVNPVKIDPVIRQNIPIHTFLTKMKDIYLKKNEIYDDMNDMAKEELKESYLDIDKEINFFEERENGGFQVHCKAEEDGGCYPYVEIQIHPSNKKLIYKRTYKKFFGTLSEFGGINEIVFFLIAFVFTLWVSMMYQRSLRKDIFKQEGGSLNNNRSKAKSIEAQDKLIRELQDGLELFKNINLVEVLSDIYLKRHDRALIPLVLLNIEQRKITEERSSKIKILPKIDAGLSPEEALDILKKKQMEGMLEEEIKKFILENLEYGKVDCSSLSSKGLLGK